MTHYWSLIDTPFQMMAAWVDGKGRLLRFYLRGSPFVSGKKSLNA